MQALEPVWTAGELKKGYVYQIHGTLYRYLGSDPYAQINHPKYKFRPLAGQRKKADLVLNKNNFRNASLVPGYKASQVSEVNEKSVQLKLL